MSQRCFKRKTALLFDHLIGAGLPLRGAGIARLSDSLVRDAIIAERLVELLPEFRSVYPDGDPPAMWVLAAHRDLPLRIRLLADHIAEGLLAYRRGLRP
jgi:DNA-binding transcriptional LysR family regulator